MKVRKIEHEEDQGVPEYFSGGFGSDDHHGSCEDHRRRSRFSVFWAERRPDSNPRAFFRQLGDQSRGGAVNKN